MTADNPERLGELSKLYLIIGNDFDTTQDDATILADGSWEEFCVISFNRGANNSLRQVKDRCSGDNQTYSYGRTENSISFSLNQFRLTPAQKKSFDSIIPGKKIVSALCLTGDRTNTETFGVVGNFVLESNTEEQPEEGNNTESYTLKEAARSSYRVKPVYGADFT